MSTSAVFGFPFLPNGAASVDVIINEYIAMTEALHVGKQTVGDNSPPGGSSLMDGMAWVVGSSPTGAWAGHANAIAYRFAGEWRFVPGFDDDGAIIPMGSEQAGMTAFNTDDNTLYHWTGAAWST